jgi:uncharacterized repeat protein (TIGR01451 family)
MRRPCSRARVFRFISAVLITFGGLIGAPVSLVAMHAEGAGADPAFASGVTSECETLNGEIDPLLVAIGGPLGLLASALIPAIPEPGWVWIDPTAAPDNAQRFRAASGVVKGEDQVARTDFPTVHDSHDFFFNVDTEAGQDDLLSVANEPNEEGAELDTQADLVPPEELHIEWEIGTFPSETGSDPERTFPKWVWPNLGDRVYVDGDWIYDCGHPTEISDTGAKLFRSEIHPARAIATMRQQMKTMPGSGTTPVPVTATELYIHGHAGLAVDDLVCGPDIIVDDGTCAPDPYPRRGTPIDDDYQFEICLPTAPFDKAVPAVKVQNGPGNTVTDSALAPNLDRDADGVIFEEPAAGSACDDPATPGTAMDRMIEVEIPLDGSGVTPEDKYSRQIYAGWIFPSDDLRHLKVSLNKMILHDDMDIDPGDCECTFFFMSNDRAPDEWARLNAFDIPTEASGDFCPDFDNTLSDWDSDDGAICPGTGELNFSGPNYDFYVGNGQNFTVQARGYDQDCLDDRMGEIPIATSVGGLFVPTFDGLQLGSCFLPGLPEGFCATPGFDNCADNDAFPGVSATFGAPSYGVGAQTMSADEYEAHFTVEEVPLTVEDSSDLVLTKDCKPDQGALAGVEFTCTILVQNPQGPGLPHDVVVHDTLLTDVDPSDYVMSDPVFTFSGLSGFSDPCVTQDNPVEEIPGGKEFTCDIGTVPIGGKAIVTVHITSQEGGDFNDYADVFSGSTDPNLANNFDSDSVPVTAVSDLGVVKSDSVDPLNSNTAFTYSLDVTNHGPSTAVNVVANDFMPDGVAVTSVSGTGGASCVFGVPGDDARPTTCHFDSMAPSESQTMTVGVTVLPGVHNTLQNEARVSSDVLDRNNANNVDKETTTIQVADLEITKTSDADVYKSSGTVKYTLTVDNHGPADAFGVIVTDDLPLKSTDRVTFGPTTACSKPAGGTLLTCAYPKIPAGQTRVINVTITFKGSRGLVTNTASVVSSTFDPDPANDLSTRTVIVGSVPKP